MKVINAFRGRIANFDRNEKGMETLQVVLIIAVAAVILAFFVNQWPAIKGWAEGVIQTITGFTQ